MTDFVFGVENYCSVKFIGDESHPNRFAWFSDVEKLMMKNGFGIEEVINYGEEIFDIEGVNNYYILEYGNTKRYFKELMLNSFIINKRDLLEYYQPIDELIEKNLNFLYLIDAGDYMKIPFIFLSDKILDWIKKEKCIVVLNTSYEPYSHEQTAFINVVEMFVDRYNLNANNLKIISGNLIVNNLPEQRYEFIPYCYFLENPWFIPKDVFPTDSNYEENKQKIGENFKIKLEEFIQTNRNIKSFDRKVLCYNRRPHPHRRYLFYKMLHDDFLNQHTYLSLNNEEYLQFFRYDYMYGTSVEESNAINIFYNDNIKNWTFDGYDININLANSIDESFHKKTFVSFVSETSVVNTVVFFSEKIFKPIYCCQPFILSGNPFSLKKLKEFGFKTFDKWWDESYDNEIDYGARLQKMMSILSEICKKSDEELCTMLNEMEETLIHNFNVFANYKNQELIKSFSQIKFKKTIL